MSVELFIRGRVGGRFVSSEICCCGCQEYRVEEVIVVVVMVVECAKFGLNSMSNGVHEEIGCLSWNEKQLV